jgi:lysophospholipase L1-like esterase
LVAVSRPSPPVDPRSYLAGVVAELEKAWPDNRTVNIAAHGHSVPAGYFKTPLVDSFDAYPLLLHRRLAAAFPHAVINVIVTAIGGEDSSSGAQRFERDVLSLRPDVVLIDYGLNDRRLGLDKARRAWSRMIEQAQAAGARVILLTPTADAGADLDDPGDPLNLHAAQIRELAASYRVALADSLAAVRAYLAGGGRLDDLMAQTNHPNRKGHDLVADELMRWFPASQAAK